MRVGIICATLALVGSIGLGTAHAAGDGCDECMATCHAESEDDEITDCLEGCERSDVCRGGGVEAPEYEEPPGTCGFAQDDCREQCTGVRKPFDLCMSDCLAEAGCE